MVSEYLNMQRNFVHLCEGEWRIYIKNMYTIRCINSVKSAFLTLGMTYKNITVIELKEIAKIRKYQRAIQSGSKTITHQLEQIHNYMVTRC